MNTQSTFFTAYAAAAVRTSRDPLGLIPIWSRLGRRVVPNVRTTAGDLRGWSTLLLGVAVVSELQRVHSMGAQQARNAFLRMEQICGASRLAWASDVPAVGGVRGSERIVRRLTLAGPMFVGERDDARILEGQWSAGVWGQVSRSAVESGLLAEDGFALTPGAARLWSEHWRPELWSPWGPRLSRLLLEQPGGAVVFEPRGGDADLARRLAHLLGPRLAAPEFEVYDAHILWGANASRSASTTGGELGAASGHTADLVSRELARALARLLIDSAHATGASASAGGSSGTASARPLDLVTVSEWADAADARGEALLAERLRDIVVVEQVIGPADQLFAWLRDPRSGATTVKEAEQRLAHPEAWGVGSWLSRGRVDTALERVAAHGAEHSSSDEFEALARFGRALADGDWGQCVRAVVDRSATVMRRRNWGPWISEDGGKLQIRVDGRGELPRRDRARNALAHSYYLAPFAALTATIRRSEPSRSTTGVAP